MMKRNLAKIHEKFQREVTMKELFKQYKMQLLLILYGILTIGSFYARMGNGLDSSWEYALNKFTAFDHIKFGRDVVFTYGPLGFLMSPMYINGNFFISVILYALLWASILILFYKLVRDEQQSIYIVLISLFVLYLGCPANAADLYFQYSVLMALAVLWKNREDKFAVVFAISAVTISFYFKFSVAVAVMASWVLFLVSIVIMKRHRRIWILFLPCLTIPVCYMVYDHSIQDFLGYIKGSWEIAKGFNTAMSLNENDRYVVWMFGLIVIYVAFMISQLVYKKEENFWVCLWFAPCLFMSYKHGYVRADQHVVSGYIEILATFSIELLLLDFKGIYNEVILRSKKGMIQGGLFLVLVIITLVDYPVGLQPLGSMRNRIQNIASAFYFMTERRNEENVDSLEGIPDAFFEEIEDSTYTSYPTEITFIEKGRKTDKDSTENIASNFIPLFTLQIYSAYTPYLDAKTADALQGTDAPEYMIFTFVSIDGRITLMEAPSTWKAIRENYEIVMYDPASGYYLLQHKQNVEIKTGKTEKTVLDKEDIVTFNGCSEAKIYANLSLAGKLTNLIWKIPEVKAKITYKDGSVREGRVLLDNLSNGIMVSGMPYDYDTLYNAMFSDGINCTIESIEFFGDGLEYYKDAITVEYMYYDDIPKADLSYLAENLDLSGMIQGDLKDVAFTLDVKQLDPMLDLQGWAYITGQNIDYNIYVKINGEYYAVSKIDGSDVVNYLGIPGNSNVRFSIKLPIKLEGLVRFVLITEKSYYEFDA